ncbi:MULTISPECIES: nuclear transport factor 2 family protein [unclassified Azospirillum]|uniref:YybH family protein n=1 Tax=unclassified Azospirillum TaxID=2630922 RepID=UPI000B6D1770|nr:MULTISPECIES: nuclear transport factor 2 family protein [unclassified Azospirillum]SNS67060.1 conserved hypothetical protein [Azospirillum sp. RU38E]SNS85309.1 conserved hypothetical protein [Azospirillum sp. RU37A]
MILSIRKALQISAEKVPGIADGDAGLTRSTFLKGVTAGLVSAGIAGPMGEAAATSVSRIAPVTDIDKLYDAWQERFNAADLDALVDLYVADVTYVNPDGTEMVGQSRVRDDFKGLLALKPKIDLNVRKHLLYKDIALTTNHWTLRMPKADGTLVELTGGGIEVMQKQRDGGWRYVIDDASRSAS